MKRDAKLSRPIRLADVRSLLRHYGHEGRAYVIRTYLD
jgi:hypothetical protein